MDNTDIKLLVEHLTRLEEGEIGRKIGSAIGGIFGKDAGDRLGQIGSNIGNIFDPATKTVVKGDPAAGSPGPATPGPATPGPATPGSNKAGPPGSSEPTDDKSWQVKAGPNAATAADQKFFMKNPDGSASEVTPPPGGFGRKGKDPTNARGQEIDSMVIVQKTMSSRIFLPSVQHMVVNLPEEVLKQKYKD